MSNLEAAQSGDPLRALEQARDTLATAIDGAVSRGDGTVAQLVAQYRASLADIEELKRSQPAEQESELDRIRNRRAARDGVAADHPRAAGDRQPRKR
jgi:hypothetical protein